LKLRVEAKIGKKYAIYLPREVVRALDLREGDRISLTVSEKGILIEKIEDPIRLAIEGDKFASMKPKQVEEVSLGEQKRYIKGPT